MAQPLTMPGEFDPLVELYGMWNTGLAERYLPIPRAHAGKYECLGGYLIMSPYEGPANSFGQLKLGMLLHDPAQRAGFVPYLNVNLRFAPDTWIEPDLAVLQRTPADDTWVSTSEVLVPVEFVSPSRKRRDRIDKPALCAEAGIPWYLRVEIDRARSTAYVRLDRLVDGGYTEHASAHDGQRFTITEPFPLDFDPAILLEP